MGDEEAVQRWERRGQLPLIAASLLYLTAYTLTVLDRDASPAWREAWSRTMIVTWALFAADYLVRLALSRRRWTFVRGHWLDVIVLALPALRPLALIRYLYRRRPRNAAMSLEGEVMAYSGLTALLLGFVGALSVLRAERGARGATIESFGDAVWWVCVTLSTTGYGDVVPVTFHGRLVGVLLMSVGVGLIGAVVGVFSSWLVQSFRRRDAEDTGRGGGKP
ncbi:ion transporter [Streptomyces sp. F63]|uniref:potassium channel family protein n=1 Tax=Streptomyces sp. F63 TaxID=2824887 RepID=UPI001B39B26B|nr:potassium channel family protein [Streptomyces sp. F63]MBQ0988327.1 ion transporter [Streptomyces sp. F63]